jgi:triosephosphate isomerase
MGKLIVANWKMNGALAKINADLSYYAHSADTNKSNVILALPYLYLVWAKQVLLAHSNIRLAAQDLSHYRDCGAYTGKINGSMLKDAGVGLVIIGHSERRNLLGESDDIVREKIQNAYASNLIPILCVGEALELRKNGNYLAFIEAQLDQLATVALGPELIIAYEPCWAIGTGLIPSLKQIEEVGAFICWYMQKLCAYAKITVLYGGSVTPHNAEEILTISSISGLLVGGASLKVADFSAICAKI